jgi:hypothetical protein
MRGKKKPHLAEVLKKLGPQPELADAIEREMTKMRKLKMRRVKL